MLGKFLLSGKMTSNGHLSILAFIFIIDYVVDKIPFLFLLCGVEQCPSVMRNVNIVIYSNRELGQFSNDWIFAYCTGDSTSFNPGTRWPQILSQENTLNIISFDHQRNETTSRNKKTENKLL